MSDDSGSNESGIGVHESLRKWRKTDDLDALRMRVHRALRIAEAIAYAEGSTRRERLKACTVMQQTARTYLKVVEVQEIEERLSELEAFRDRYQENHITNGQA